MTTFAVDSTEQPVRNVSLLPGATHSALAFGSGRTVPLTIPASQEYYWQHAWQQGERETLAALAEGNSVLFDSDDPEDIVRWLHAAEDNDADPD